MNRENSPLVIRSMDRKTILLHICCAPCACYPLVFLVLRDYSVTGYWNNSNIHPFAEYSKRLMTLGYLRSAKNNFSLIQESYDPAVWFSRANGLKKKDRCSQCYIMRIEAAARRAAEDNMDCFTTTLLYSKFQDHNAVISCCEKAAVDFNVEFFYHDFRDGWKEGIIMSKEAGLYRQYYCGCLFSEMER